MSLNSQPDHPNKRKQEVLEQLTREGRARLYPSLANPNWLVLKKRREILEQWIADLPRKQLRILDIGGRIQPYRPLLENRIGTYIAIDLRPTPLVSVLARGQQLPFRDSQFDLVLCTQMLQYTQEPAVIVNEAARVLKSGGSFFLSVPSVYPIDAEGECWRFLPGGLRHMLAPFHRVQVVAEGRSVSGFFRTLNVCLSIFVRYPWLRSVLQYTAYPLVNLAGALLEKLSGSSNEQFAVNFSVLAEK